MREPHRPELTQTEVTGMTLAISILIAVLENEMNWKNGHQPGRSLNSERHQDGEATEQR